VKLLSYLVPVIALTAAWLWFSGEPAEAGDPFAASSVVADMAMEDPMRVASMCAETQAPPNPCVGNPNDAPSPVTDFEMRASRCALPPDPVVPPNPCISR
jgi:hypothetical protein